MVAHGLTIHFYCAVVTRIVRPCIFGVLSAWGLDPLEHPVNCTNTSFQNRQVLRPCFDSSANWPLRYGNSPTEGIHWLHLLFSIQFGKRTAVKFWPSRKCRESYHRQGNKACSVDKSLLWWNQSRRCGTLWLSLDGWHQEGNWRTALSFGKIPGRLICSHYEAFKRGRPNQVGCGRFCPNGKQQNPTAWLRMLEKERLSSSWLVVATRPLPTEVHRSRIAMNNTA